MSVQGLPFSGEAPYPSMLHQATLDALFCCGGEHIDGHRMIFLKMLGRRGVFAVLNPFSCSNRKIDRARSMGLRHLNLFSFVALQQDCA